MAFVVYKHKSKTNCYCNHFSLLSVSTHTHTHTHTRAHTHTCTHTLHSHTHSHTHTHTLIHTPQRAHTSLRRLSTSDVTTSSSASSSTTTTASSTATDQSTTDDLQNHIMMNAPKKGEVDVPLGSSITVHFDKDVKTVNINKLFEVILLFLGVCSPLFLYFS